VLDAGGGDLPAARDPRTALEEAERVKEALSASEAETFAATDPATGARFSQRYTRGAFEDLLEANGLYAKINSVLDAAEKNAGEHGYNRDALQAALMIGGSSLIPSVRRLVRGRYGDRARCERPFDAVAVGAAAWVAGVGFDDRIRHSYALRPRDRATGRLTYFTLVKAGTPYPCVIADPAKLDEPLVHTIWPTQDQQTRLGLQVYEVAERNSLACGGGGLDLVFDQNGSAVYSQRRDEDDLTHRPIGSMTFIAANPPARKGEARFAATFAIDAQRQLCVTVVDNRTGKTLCRDQPMVKLT
jgi:molecular chaperone DnaK (HSP70)